MKQIKYIIVILLLTALHSCVNTPTTDSPDTNDAQLRADFLKQTEMGVYSKGAKVLFFDKEVHQLYINPTQLLIRIQDTEGELYTELRLDKMPSEEVAVKATLIDNIDMGVAFTGDVILLKKSADRLWIWNEKNGVGMLFPWI